MRSESRWARIPYGLLGMFALVFAVERQTNASLRGVMNVTAATWAFAAESADRESWNGAVLCFGDSLAKFGLQPRVLEARLGARARNFAGYSSPPSNDYFLLRRILARGDKPRALIVTFNPAHLDWRTADHAPLLAEYAHCDEALDLARAVGDANFFASYLANRILPTLRCRFELREGIGRQLEGFPWERPPLLTRLRENWTTNLGAQANIDAPPAAPNEQQIAAIVGSRFTDPRAKQPVQAEYVRRFLELAARQGIPVYWVLPPFLPGVRSRREQAGIEAFTTDVSRQLQIEHPELRVIDGRAIGLDESYYCDDFVHLNRRGSAVFTAAIADAIANSGNNERFVALGPVKNSPTSIELDGFSVKQLARPDTGGVRR